MVRSSVKHIFLLLMGLGYGVILSDSRNSIPLINKYNDSLRRDFLVGDVNRRLVGNNAPVFKRQVTENSENILRRDPLADYLRRRTPVNRAQDHEDAMRRVRKNNKPIKKPSTSRRMRVQNNYHLGDNNSNKAKQKLRKKNEKNIMIETNGKSVRRDHNTDAFNQTITNKQDHRRSQNVKKVSHKTTKAMNHRRKTKKNKKNSKVKRRSNKILDPIEQNEIIRKKNKRIHDKNRKMSKKKENKRRKMENSQHNDADNVKLQTEKKVEIILQNSTSFPTIKPVLAIQRNHKNSVGITVVPTTALI